MATTAGRKPKLTCPSPTTTTGGARGPRFPYRRRGTVRQRETSPQLANPNRMKSTRCAFSSPTTTTSQPKGTTKPTVYRRQWKPLPYGLLVLSSSKPLTGRTGHQLRDASAPGTTGDTAFTGTLPLPDKDSLHYNDMPCWLHSIEATTPAPAPTPERRDTISHPTPRRSQTRTSHRAPLDTDTYPLTPTPVQAPTPLLSTGHSMAKLTPIDTYTPIRWPNIL